MANLAFPPLLASPNADPNADRAVAERSLLIKNLLEDLNIETMNASNAIPVQNVSCAAISPPPSATSADCADVAVGQRICAQEGY